MKKLTLFLLAVLTAVISIMTPVYAAVESPAADVTVTVKNGKEELGKDADINPGEELSYVISIHALKKIYGVTLLVNYDTSAFDVIEATHGQTEDKALSAQAPNIAESKNPIKFTAFSDKGTNNNNKEFDILKLTVAVRENCLPGSYKFTVNVSDSVVAVLDDAGNVIKAPITVNYNNITAGEFTVTAEETVKKVVEAINSKIVNENDKLGETTSISDEVAEKMTKTYSATITLGETGGESNVGKTDEDTQALDFTNDGYFNFADVAYIYDYSGKSDNSGNQ